MVAQVGQREGPAEPERIGLAGIFVEGDRPIPVSVSTVRSRKGAASVTLVFNGPLDPNTAGNPGNYGVKVSTSARGPVRKSIGVFARYNAAHNSVTLQLS